MPTLADAIGGKTVQFTAAELFSEQAATEPPFFSEACLATWCNTFGLQYNYNEQTTIYTISKPS